MSRIQDQRYVPTDVRCQIIHFLWTIGFKYEGTRALMADKILRALDEEQRCESVKEASLLNGSEEGP